MADNKNIDASKLVFKPSFLEAKRITVLIKSLGRHYPMTREQIIDCVGRGMHHDKLNSWFTQKSIKSANKTNLPVDKKAKDES